MKQKLQKPKYRFWLALAVSATILLLEVIPRTGVYAAKSATEIPREELIRADVVKQAQNFLNLPYKFGGAEPTGFDCGGLVLYLYNRHGFTMPHGVIYMRPTLRKTDTPQKGDVIFFLNENNIVGHVGIYVDEERFIHAPKAGAVIRYEKLKHPYWKRRLIEYRSVF